MRLRLVMFLVIGPLIALACFFAADELQMQWDDYSLARETREKTLEETLVNTLVHEMQKERGYSAGSASIASATWRWPRWPIRCTSTWASASTPSPP